jgi:hypothetical protein
VVPEAELEVIKRRCCCGGTEPGGISCPECPTPVAPCVCPVYEIERFFVGVTGDSAGYGQLYWSTFRIKGCMRGSCGRTPYRRKSVSPSNQFGLDCDPSTYDDCVCANLIDEDGPSIGGDFYWRGSPCGSGCEADELDYEGAVAPYDPQWLFPQVFWNAVPCQWGTSPPGLPNDCRSLVVLEFTYSDTYANYRNIDCEDGECTQSGTHSLSVSQTWTCWYSRRVQAGQYMATGIYRLVRCDYPAAITTIGPGTGNTLTACNDAGGTVCSADGLSAVGKVPTLWQPPGSIKVNRLC